MRFRNGKIMCRNAKLGSGLKCSEEKYPMEKLKEKVLQAIQMQISSFTEQSKKTRQQGLAECEQAIHGCNSEITRLEMQGKEMYEQYAVGDLTKEEYLQKKRELLETMAPLKRRKEQAEKELREVEQRKAFASKDFSKYAEVTRLTPDIVEEFIHKIYFFDAEHIEIVWNDHNKSVSEL